MPTGDLDSDSADTTEYSYTLAQDQSVDPDKWPITRKTVRRPAVAMTAGADPAWYAIEKSAFDDNGNLTHFGVGSEHDFTLNPFFYAYYEYDEQGRKTREVFDTAENSIDGFARASETLALELETTYEYDPTYGLIKITFPNGREHHIVYVEDPADPYALEQWVYRDVVPGEQGDPATLFSPVELNEFESGRLIRKTEIAVTDSINYPPIGSVSCPPAEVISTSVPTYNAYGQIVGMQRTGGDSGPSLSATIAYHATGQISRQENPDGSITRHTYDDFGRLHRTYRGTSDIHMHWGTAGGEQEPDDNLVLIEKRLYGIGVTDAGELATVGHYRNRPAIQYDWVWEPVNPWGNYHWVLAPTNDPDPDWSTEHEYDWRMREVWATRWDAAGGACGHTVTWYDH